MMYKIFIQGIVQGVGFRPYIYRKALEHKLVGTVKNTGNGVEIIINDKDFIQKLTDLPPLAKITDTSIHKISSSNEYRDFSIIKSEKASGETILPADIFMCSDCLNELHDKKNRRSYYYFITCTNCGPRFSMIKDYPYDRPLTSMNSFLMCNECQKEYTDPLNRRYHAQTIACKNCGPKLRLLHLKKDISEQTDKATIEKATSLIKKNHLIAIKGVGGFHLCALTNNDAVQRVRLLLHRPDKPFALMVKDIEMIAPYVYMSDQEKEMLLSPQRPIVILKKKDPDFFQSVTELDSVGVMLPYTALHFLLFDTINEPLLMTSCNIPGEPVSISEKIGQYFLTHEREIINRCDDSVLKIIDDKSFFLRRSRGFTPLPVSLPIVCEDSLGVGAELNNVICSVKQNKCFLSQYIGETSQYETLQFLKSTIDTFIRLTRLKPKIIACDVHPGYSSTKLANDLSKKFSARLIPIQHHKAHVASVAAEHEISTYVGIAIDGLGYGENEALWGGEIFSVKNDTEFDHCGQLELQPQISGDYATIYPKRMLFGIVSKFLSENELKKSRLFEEKDIMMFTAMLHDNFNVSYTSSTGRILDAASAFLGLCEKRTYDGRPAMLLESYASIPYPFEPIIKQENGKSVLLTTPLFKFLWENKNKDKRRLAATVQMYLAKGLYTLANSYREDNHVPIVASGGVLYNRMISDFFIQKGVLLNKEIPCGDGGICLGQAYLANLYAKSE